MMKTLKQLALAMLAVLALSGTGVHAASTGFAWDKAPNKTNDLGALQNGAKLFVNTCLNCHSAAFMRYNRLTDIGLTEQQIKDNLLFATDKVGDTMKAAIDPKQARDKSRGARSRSSRAGSRSRLAACLPCSTTRPWAISLATCNGWVSRHRTSASGSVSGCCCFFFC